MQTAQRPGLIRPVVVFIGPSGSGKSSVVRVLADRGLLAVHPTWTTRLRRVDEQHGSLEHRFVSDAEFDRLGRRGFFMETVTLFGLPYRYGLPHLLVGGGGGTDAVMLRAPLVSRFAQHVPELVVYQIADRADRTRARLVARGTSTADMAARLIDNEVEVDAGRRIADRTFINDGSLEELVERVEAALTTDVAARAGVAA